MGLVTLLYGVLCYLIFFATFLYLIVFVGGDSLAFLNAPKTIDFGEPAGVFAAPALQNILLILLFGLSHSVMARPGFKAAWTKIVPKAAERSTYVLIASLSLILLYAYWRPMPAEIWSMGGAWSGIMLALFLAGWGTVLLATFLINHFDLFGLRQSWHAFKKTEKPNDPFATPFFYGATRHPLYLGFVVAFWATPMMSAGHLLFSALMTIYIFVAIGYEERDLIAHFGEDYRRYMERVPALFPVGRRK